MGQPNNKLVSVIIPTWNGKELLKNCLPSIFKQTYDNLEIIVVDNGSSDGSDKYIKINFPKIKIVKLSINSGFSPAINIGIKHCKGDYIVLINNDTKLDRQCIRYLVKAAEDHKDVGLVAAKMLSYYNPDVIDSAGDYIDVVGHANNIGYGEKDSNKFNIGKYVFLVTAGGCLIKSEVIKKIGLFDDDYFAYFEDVDYCLRAQFQGLKCYYEPKSVIFHIHKATSRKNNSLTEYLQYRNMTMTIIKDFPGFLLTNNFNWLRIILVNLNTIRYLAGKGYLKSALEAEWYILKNISNLLEKRKEVQSKIIVSKDYVINNFKLKKITFFGLFKPGI